MKKLRSHQLAMSKMICKAANHVLLPGDVKFICNDFERQCKVFHVISRITDLDLEFDISNAHYHSRVLPQKVLDLLDHLALTQSIMYVARDLRPFNDDLRPLFSEETQKFSVRIGHFNPCFPLKAGWTREYYRFA